jgi:hypothetical protein
LKAAVSNGADYYKFYCYSGDSTEPDRVITADNPRLVINDLTPGSVYRFRVSAVRALAGQAGIEETALTAETSEKCKTFVEAPESFTLRLRNPEWSKTTSLTLNGEAVQATDGYIAISREWKCGDCLELSLDMRCQAILPIPYGSQILMNHVIWGANYMIPTFDEEDPIAHRHIALRRGPLMLAQENRLGYSVDDPVEIDVSPDGYVEVSFPENTKAPYDNIIELEVPLTDGTKMTVTDYASAGKTFNEESKMAVWFLTK